MPFASLRSIGVRVVQLATALLFVSGRLSAQSTPPACPTISGADQLWSNPLVHWIWLGEMHGSNETPAAFFALVCNAVATGRPVTVALERFTTEQTSLDAVLTSPDLPAAEKLLLQQPGWRDVLDGRSSEAMLRLLLSLRDLRQHYPSLKVVAADGPSYTGALGSRDEAIGHTVLSLKSDQPGQLIFVLTGNVHGMLAPIFGFETAAMFLPPQELISLEATDRGGEVWNMTSKGCGITQNHFADKSKTRSYGIYLDPALAPYSKANGIFALGAPLTASPPAAGIASPPPVCRTQYLAQPAAAPAKN
jgi:hypothetical protein